MYNSASHGNKHTFRALGVTKEFDYSLAATEEFLDYVVREVVAELSYESDHVSIQFLADPSCIYQTDQAYNLYATIRGIVIIHTERDTTEADDEAVFRILDEWKWDTDYIFPIDVHMNLYGNPRYTTIVRLDETF